MPNPSPAVPAPASAQRHDWRLSFVVWAVVLAATLVLIALAGQWAADREEHQKVGAMRRAVELHALGLSDAAGKHRHLPHTVGLHPLIQAALARAQDGEAIRRANLYLQEVNQVAGAEALYLIDLKGLTLAASNWNSPLSFVNESYANRPYFLDAAAGRQGLFYGVGQTTGEPGLFIASPVRAPADGSVIGVVAVKVSFDALQQSWAAERDPVFVTDARGVVFLSSEPSWLYAATRALDAEDLRTIRQNLQYGDRTHFARLPWQRRPEAEPVPSRYLVDARVAGKSRRLLAMEGPLAELGWSLTVTADHGDVALAREQAWLIGLLAATVLLLGGLYWQLRERRFVEQRNARRDLEIRVRERTQALDEAHAVRKAMEDSLPVGMGARDLEGRITYVNPAFCTMTGFEAGELLGRLPPYPFWDPDEMTLLWQRYEATIRGQSGRVGLESPMRHRDGHALIAMVYTAPLIDAAGRHTGWMNSIVDITEQKRAEERLRRHDEQLQHAQRLASLGEMASTLAHELNQPLMALSNYASAAQAFALQGRQALLLESLGKAVAEVERSADIVRGIRGFVRHRTMGIENCAVPALVANALALLQGELHQRKARATVQLPPDLPLVRGDRVLLEQVLLNLLSNGLQAMQATPQPQRVVSIDAELRAGRVQIRVADRGCGIDAALAEQVFAPFFTTKAEGLGLGLNICRTIVEAHGGKLFFAAREGGGTTFTLELEITPS
ncbi:PAS domain S-box protein [Xenophilus arseniciresistens]|uniref:histidine kinase n=1 Tax=Xenophilus arseniciresistens TaxID=1283306 RepID=A0AAE3N8K3_9BURK|nr:ATP-binding protein [Xenophilus arseniciresistens]MDA7416913.1 PAS domain S-box protein [Xenophilus arseniciresistens]